MKPQNIPQITKTSLPTTIESLSAIIFENRKINIGTATDKRAIGTILENLKSIMFDQTNIEQHEYLVSSQNELKIAYENRVFSLITKSKRALSALLIELSGNSHFIEIMLREGLDEIVGLGNFRREVLKGIEAKLTGLSKSEMLSELQLLAALIPTVENKDQARLNVQLQSLLLKKIREFVNTNELNQSEKNALLGCVKHLGQRVHFNTLLTYFKELQQNSQRIEECSIIQDYLENLSMELRELTSVQNILSEPSRYKQKFVEPSVSQEPQLAAQQELDRQLKAQHNARLCDDIYTIAIPGTSQHNQQLQPSKNNNDVSSGHKFWS